MRLYELFEEPLDELDMSKLKNTAAAVGIAATLVTAPIATQDDSKITQPQVVKTQPEVVVEPKHDVLPKNLSKMAVADKKKAFFDLIIPIAKKLNQEILNQRKFVMTLKSKGTLSDNDQSQLNKLMKEYKTDKIDTLLSRLDIIPVSIITAQAAIESGWGTSRFAQQGNSLFGQRDYAGGGMKPKNASGFTVAKFGNITDSVRSYIRNLNTFTAYSNFRKIRKTMRARGKNIDPLKLIQGLTKYSTRGQAYIADIASVIRFNKLQKHDSAT